MRATRFLLSAAALALVAACTGEPTGLVPLDDQPWFGSEACTPSMCATGTTADSAQVVVPSGVGLSGSGN